LPKREVRGIVRAACVAIMSGEMPRTGGASWEHGTCPFRRAGQRVSSASAACECPRTWTGFPPARMLEAEAPKHDHGRQVFWLTAFGGPRSPSQGICPQWPGETRASPITAAAPQRNCTVFPIGLPHVERESLSDVVRFRDLEGKCPTYTR